MQNTMRVQYARTHLSREGEAMGCKFEHIGVLVRNRELAAASLQQMPGAGEAVYMDKMNFDETCVQVGAPFAIKGANITVGGVEYEIIEVIPEESEGSYMMKRLAEYGEGLHHIAFEYDSLAEFTKAAEALVQQGYTVGHKASIPFMGKTAHVYYLDCPSGGLTYEMKCMV